ncbi:MAG: ATP-binding protein [Vicinamibacteria bacterium]|nr:ATP-binding protein [Vicinamibacteria bacterium]
MSFSLLRRFRNLSLNGKITLTLTAVFVAVLIVVLAALLPLERDQHVRLFSQNERLLSTLRDKYQRNFIHDIISDHEDSIIIDLTDLAQQAGILWVQLDADRLRWSATAHPPTIARLLGSDVDLPASADDARVLIVRGSGSADLVGADGRRILEGHAVDLSGLISPFTASGDREEAQEMIWQGISVIASTAPLKAGDRNYGRLGVVYSLAEDRVREARTRLIVYGTLGVAFLLLLLLLNLLIARIVIAPVHRVGDAMRQASKGAMNVRLPIHSRDEIGLMAESFNGMVNDLAVAKHEIEDYSHNLERMVVERTQELIRVKNHLATIIANVATGVLSLDEQGRITTLNERAGEILGVTEAAASGLPIEEVLGGGETRRLLDFIASVRGGGPSPKKGQVQVRLKEGTRTLSVVASVLLGEERARIGTVVVFDDLTQLLATQRLEAWKEAVERVIHEIKNPLTPVGLSAQTLRSAYEQDRARFDEIFLSANEMILGAVKDLKALIGEFTQFSRLPAAVFEPHDLNELVRAAAAAYVSGDETRVRLDLSLEPLPIDADAVQFKRVLMNVINNAIESLEGCSGTVQIETARSIEGGQAQVVIRDQGCGVEDVERIFEPYYTTKVKGTGLGLVIARQIIEEHGGTIRAASTIGVGTSVTIALPLRAAHAV